MSKTMLSTSPGPAGTGGEHPRLELDYANARVELGRLAGLGRLTEFRAGDWLVRVAGWPGWRVDYADMAYATGPDAVGEALERAASAWLADPDQTHRLADLSGEFLILASRGDRLELAAASDELPNQVYWWRLAGDESRVIISDDLWPRLAGFGLHEPQGWSRANLAYMSHKKTCLPGQTLIKGVGRFMAGTVHRLAGATVEPLRAVIPHNQHGDGLTHDDLLAAIGRRLPPGPYTLSYSSGIDSHHLLAAFAPDIQQVCNISYLPPYQDPDRSLESAAALANTAARSLPLTLVEVDLHHPMNRTWLEHALDQDPFACHLNFSMYQMMARVDCRRLLSGQNADTVQWFGLTSTIPWGLAFCTSPLPNYPHDWHRLHYRWCVARSYDGLRGQDLLDRRLFYGQWERLGRLVERRGYWPLMWFKRVNNMTSGNTQLFRNAALWFGKEVYFPYLEPLVLYVSCYWRRPLATMRDPKARLRSLHPERLDHRSIPARIPRGKGFDQSPVFLELAGELEAAAPGLKAFLDGPLREPMARGFGYALALKALAAAQAGR